MLTRPSQRPAYDGFRSPSTTVAYQLLRLSATWSLQMNGTPTAYTKTSSSSSTTIELRSRNAESTAESNCGRASSRIRPFVTNRRTIGGSFW